MFLVKYLLICSVMHLAENKVLPLPSAPGSDGRCSEEGTYLDRKLKLCCSKCDAGFHVKNFCTATSDTVCERCSEGTYMDIPNHSRNCFRCKQCQEDWKLTYARACTASSDAECACQPGTYCSYRERDVCNECSELPSCPPGEGVSTTHDDSEVVCSPCLAGTFSDQTSNRQTCQPHTDCESQGRKTLRPGNATSDSKCGPIVTPNTKAPSTARSHPTSSTFSTSFTHKQAPSSAVRTPELNKSVALLVAGVLVPATLLVGLIAFLAVHLNRKMKGDTNNNIKKEDNKPLQGAVALGQPGSFCTPLPEQQCLLEEKGSTPDLPLSKEEEQYDLAKEARSAVQESGSVVC